MSALTELYKEIALCRKCEIAKARTKAVPGEGSENAEIMFIGEAPGWHEDQQGRPFVGPAGKFLDDLINSINLKREQVYITNVIKTRPPDNRDPLPEEITNCRPFLEKQIALINPRMIVTLGRYSMAMFFPGKSISKIHGTAQQINGVTVFAMYPGSGASSSELEAGDKRRYAQDSCCTGKSKICGGSQTGAETRAAKGPAAKNVRIINRKIP
jgi:uracil-DNA glycosylase